MTYAIPVQCSTNYANKPAGSWSFCGFVIIPIELTSLVFIYRIRFFVRMRVLYLRRLLSYLPMWGLRHAIKRYLPTLTKFLRKEKNCALDKHFLKKKKFSRKKAFISYRVFVASRIIDCVFSTFRHFNLLWSSIRRSSSIKFWTPLF